MGPVVLSVSQVTKVFDVPNERQRSLKDLFMHGPRRAGSRRFSALEEVTFQVHQGEFFSIIGQNGSGKSTLLKILARIYEVTSGTVSVRGRLSPFIELGVGFNPELTGRENIYLNGAILGLGRREVDRIFDDIIDFAELPGFVDQRLKNYSSGMLVRLAFSVAIRAHSDIMLIDEVLAVGDANFQEKCKNVFREFKGQGKTIVFVSHDLGAVAEFSDRVLLLNKGVDHGIHKASTAIALYRKLNDQAAESTAGTGDVSRTGGEIQLRDRRIRLLRAELLDATGSVVHIVRRGARVQVRLHLDNSRAEVLNAGLQIFRNDGLYCFGTSTYRSKGVVAPHGPAVALTVTFEELNLAKGNYYLALSLSGAGPDQVYEAHDDVLRFSVSQPDPHQGAFFLRHQWEAT